MTTTPADNLAGQAGLLDMVRRYRHLLVPVSFLLLLVVLVVPLPPALIDVLLAINLSLAAVILVSTISINKPLDFSVFPSLLLATTLFRLVLNVATTRLILTADAGSPGSATAVAGRVIEAFGNFVAGESILVGFIIFTILVVVQFVVVTKGATRMSEVAARFMLDAMPGKQMAIDSDLSSGLIDEAEAKARRKTISEEADFYGAMDGASKFVRGDAVAAIIITLVNITGGLAIGVFEKGWTVAESVSVFTRLTIGDGLVTQIPAFIIAVAAAMIVSRTSGDQSIGEDIPKQLSSQPVALGLIAGFLLVLSVTPLPTIPLLAASALLGAMAIAVRSVVQHGQAQEESDRRAQQAADADAGPPVEELLSLDALEIEIGYGLVPLVDAQRGGDLLERIDAIRRQLAVELGVVMPPIRIRDNMQLEPNRYRIKLRGSLIGEAALHPDRIMAIPSEPESAAAAIGDPGAVADKEPTFGTDAIWIDPEYKSQAEQLNWTIVDSAGVLATHLTELVRTHADELLTREEVNHLLGQLKKTSPKLVEESVPALVKVGDLQRVLQNLLRERIPIRDLTAILEAVADAAGHTRSADELTECARYGLRRTISNLYAQQDAATGKPRLSCITIDPALERYIDSQIDRTPNGSRLTMPAEARSRIVKAIGEAAKPLLEAGHQLIVLTSPAIRAHVREMLEPHAPQSVVLSYSEIVKSLDVEPMGLVQCAEFRHDVGSAASAGLFGTASA